MNNKKKKIIKIVIISLCCITLVAGTIVGSLYFFAEKDDHKYDDYIDKDYNCFAEGFTDVLITDEKSAIEAVGSVDGALGIKDEESELEIISVVPIGRDTYYKMQQIYKGIPVYGKTVNVSANNTGAAMDLTSNFAIIKDDLNITPTIAFEDLIVSLQPHLGASSIEVAGFGKEGLILFELTPNEYRLAYNLVANGINLIVDANTAEVLNAPRSILMCLRV